SVGTGRECPALAANDDHADIGITHAGIDRGNQLGDHLAIDRIELVGSVQYQTGNSSATIFANDERNFGHRVTPTDRTCEKPSRTAASASKCARKLLPTDTLRWQYSLGSRGT